MKNKNLLLSFLPIFLLVGTIIALGSVSGPQVKKENNSTCCSQKDIECPTRKQNPGGDMLLDNLSRQFMSLPVFHH
ncbi:MAG: hypothetical protein HZB42_09740 [Sphingobacteriales bacterium]|nr:hypothetical protein [Sphingobacteriales bacterium]